MISVEQLTVEFGGSPLFDEISFLVNQMDLPTSLADLKAKSLKINR